MAAEHFIVILAAGLSRRMGRQKLLLPLPDGRTVIETVIDKACHVADSGLADGVVLVVDQTSDEVLAATEEFATDAPSDGYRRIRLQNPAAHEGMSTSLRLAIQHLLAVDADAATIVLGDMPGISSDIVMEIINRYDTLQKGGDTSKLVIQPSYRGTPGHPVLFHHSLFNELLTVTGDEGGRQIIATHKSERVLMPFDMPLPPDLDTEAEYLSYLEHLRSH